MEATESRRDLPRKPWNRRGRGPLLVLLAAGVLLLSGCAEELPLNTFGPEGPGARSVDRLMRLVLVIAGVVFVFVNAAVVYIAVKFRRHKDEPNAFPKQIHGNTRLELGWTILPALILAFIAVPTVATLFNLFEVREDAPITVEVTGQQWWWSYRYDVDGDGSFDGPNDITTATELVVPAGTEVALKLTAADVIHSFWIPQLQGKRDVVPGRVHDWWVEADEPGYYLGQCTEYCGLSHAYMRMAVRAVTDEEFEQWVVDQQAPAAVPEGDEAAMRGLEVFVQQCTTCHQVDGVNSTGCEALPPEEEFDLADFDPSTDCYEGVAEGWQGAAQVSGNAPNLTHLMSRERFIGGVYDLYELEDGEPVLDAEGNKVPDINTIKSWIRDPEQFKPMAPDPNQFTTYGRGMPALPLTEEQLDDLAAYLITLK